MKDTKNKIIPSWVPPTGRIGPQEPAVGSGARPDGRHHHAPGNAKTISEKRNSLERHGYGNTPLRLRGGGDTDPEGKQHTGVVSSGAMDTETEASTSQTVKRGPPSPGQATGAAKAKKKATCNPNALMEILNRHIGWVEHTITLERAKKLTVAASDGLADKMQTIRSGVMEICMEVSRLQGVTQFSASELQGLLENFTKSLADKSNEIAGLKAVKNQLESEVEVLKASKHSDKDMKDMTDELVKLKAENERLKTEVNTLKTSKGSKIHPSPSTERTYAEVSAGGNVPRTSARVAPPLKIVLPKTKKATTKTRKKEAILKGREAATRPCFQLVCDEGEDLEEARKEVWQQVLGRTKTPRVNTTKGRNNNNLIITPDDGDTLEVLRKIKRLRELGPRLPRVIIYDVSKDLSEAEVATGLQDQNPELELTTEDLGRMRVLHRMGPKDKHVVHWVLEAPPDILGKLENRKVFLGMSRCSIKLYTAQVQCYNCQRYGHTALRCREPKAICRNCAGDHESRTCKAETVKCANCKGPHKASNTSCVARTRATIVSLRRTDFGSK